MFRALVVSGGVAVLGLAAMGCTHKPTTECADASAQSTTTELVRNELVKEVSASLHSSDNPVQVLESQIRATVAQLQITLSDVRTTKQDPNSTKRFCAATLKIVMPASTIADAETVRAGVNQSSISKLADENSVTRNADAFTSDFEYDVQPTDSGDKVFSESSDFGFLKGFYAEIIGDAMLKNALAQSQAQAQAASEAQQAEQQTALNEQKSADQAQARTENQLSNQTIAAVWKNLPDSARATMLDDERNWIRKKTADCNVEAASSSVDPAEQETARLRCDTKANQDRIALLQARSGSETPP